ncbi:hypothetical protein BDV95DRAFT_586224 [Massariosphaeria phaeospora]|uniref:Uncharacterized protein n=1 Tax=Massariosphaeria phaeospora TaxID=100035 RepID=A0A7C8M236_9PLEO|nr:hypothetical protein BDV95DRAFT_586224 [Massariosphaeria phaeospora]
MFNVCGRGSLHLASLNLSLRGCPQCLMKGCLSAQVSSSVALPEIESIRLTLYDAFGFNFHSWSRCFNSIQLRCVDFIHLRCQLHPYRLQLHPTSMLQLHASHPSTFNRLPCIINRFDLSASSLVHRGGLVQDIERAMGLLRMYFCPAGVCIRIEL